MTGYPVVEITFWVDRQAPTILMQGYRDRDSVRFFDQDGMFWRFMGRIESASLRIEKTLQMARSRDGFAQTCLLIWARILKIQKRRFQRFVLLKAKERIHTLHARDPKLVVRARSYLPFHTMSDYEEPRVFKNLITAANMSMACFDTRDLTDKHAKGTRSVGL